MSNVGIPCGVVRTVAEAAAIAREDSLIPVRLEGAFGERTFRVPNAGFHMEPGQPGTTAPPPHIDENRAEILAWLAAETPGG